MLIVGAILAALAGNLIGSGAPSLGNPGPTVSAAPSPTASATPTATASPAATVAVVLPSAITITVNNGGTPAWASWLGPAGGFLAGVGALGGLVAFRRGGPPAGPAATQPEDDR